MNPQIEGHVFKRMDFSNPEDAKEVLESLGGEILLKTKFPKVYDSFLRTVEKHKRQKSLGEGSDSSETGLKDGAFAGGITIAPNKNSGKQMLQNSSEEGLISGITSVQGIEKWSRALVSVEMKNLTQDRVIKTSTRKITGKNNYSTVQEKNLNDIISFSRQKIQNSITSKSILQGNGTMEVLNAKSDVFTTEDCVSPIESIIVHDPRSNVNNPIIMMYGRKPDHGESIDYDYQDNKIISGTDRVETWFPISGEIKFVEGFKPIGYSLKSKGNKPQLQYKNEGVCDYNYTFEEIASCFKISDKNAQIVEFKLEKDWKAELDITAYTSDHKADIGLHMFFYITTEIEGFGEEQEVGVVISTVDSLGPGESYYETKYGENAYLPYTFIKWGCFGKDTMIQMADKSFRQVSELKKGDQLLGENGKVLTIKDMVSGDEEMIFCIKTKGDRSLEVSGMHPVLTSEGAIRAQDIELGMKLLCVDGSEDEVEFAYTKLYKDRVYSVAIEGGSEWVAANGIWAGDLDRQNDNRLMAKAEEPMSDEVRQISEEFDQLMVHLGVLTD